MTIFQKDFGIILTDKRIFLPDDTGIKQQKQKTYTIYIVLSEAVGLLSAFLPRGTWICIPGCGVQIPYLTFADSFHGGIRYQTR